ncbi:unnamed protein product [Heligmosomoides polygyrus]|uniref:DUF663 domain-containing protein n=1 Tax=Heligmosomoides polygyrus TaxID=6339 RepID=A0A183GK02_HELPZ|nr:unnamed protein product [Heligmosomoides polygyrus]
MKRQLDKKHGVLSKVFDVGDYAYVQRWKTPRFVRAKGKVVKCLGAVNYDVEGELVRKKALHSKRCSMFLNWTMHGGRNLLDQRLRIQPINDTILTENNHHSYDVLQGPEDQSDDME